MCHQLGNLCVISWTHELTSDDVEVAILAFVLGGGGVFGRQPRPGLTVHLLSPNTHSQVTNSPSYRCVYQWDLASKSPRVSGKQTATVRLSNVYSLDFGKFC